MHSAGPDSLHRRDITRDDTVAWERSGAVLTDRGASLARLQDACAGSTWIVHAVLEAELIQERPGRRRTLRYRVLAACDREPARVMTWFAKQYASRKGSRIRDLLAALDTSSVRGNATSRGFAVPRVIGYHEAMRLLVTEGRAGATLGDMLQRDSKHRDLPRVLRIVGQGLASVHGWLDSNPEVERRSVSLPRHGAREEAGVIDEATHRVSAARSRQDVGRFESVARAAKNALLDGSPSASPNLLHRDLHPGQIITGEPVGFLDWDVASWGEPELDLGNLEAHLILDDHRRGSTDGESPASRLGDAVLRGYTSRRGIDDGRRSAYAAAALLRLASLERLAAPALSVVRWCDLSRSLVEEAARRV